MGLNSDWLTYRQDGEKEESMKVRKFLEALNNMFRIEIEIMKINGYPVVIKKSGQHVNIITPEIMDSAIDTFEVMENNRILIYIQ